MPLIEITALPLRTVVEPSAVCAEVNAAVAAAIGCRPDAVWTTWRTITGADVRGSSVGALVDADHGPIVHLYLKRTPEETALVCRAIEEVLARTLGLDPASVFITIQPVDATPGGE